MNWGWKIAVFMGAFIVFIMSMVVMSFGNKIDLVSEDYYQKELAFQDMIDAKQNASEFEKEVSIKQTEDGLEVSFPETFNKTIETGSITFFRPDNSALDLKKELNLAASKQLIDYTGFKPGFYSVFIDFTSNGKAYHIEKSLHL